MLWVVVELWRRRSVNTSRHPSARAQAHPVQARNFTLLRLLRAVLNLHYCFCSQPDIADPFDEPLYAWATHPPNMFCVLSRFCVARETFSSTRECYVIRYGASETDGGNKVKFEPHFNLFPTMDDDDDGIIIASSINIFSSPAGSTAGNLQIEAK